MQELIKLVQRHFHHTPAPSAIESISQAASGRTIVRIRLKTGACIGILWNDGRADNHSFVPVARHLKAHGVNVPAVYDAVELAPGCGAALTEDLGDANLLSFCSAPWHELKPRYLRAMEQLHLLHECPVPQHFALQPAFDAALYRWEQEYFAEHFLGAHLGKNPADFLNAPQTTELCSYLSALPRRPVHRDSQSQNIHLHQGKTWLIDFQGMREGRPEYDLASLLYDGYARLSAAQTEELITEWQAISGRPLNRDVFSACALQRVMQMLGAFANIGHNMGKSWYLDRIPCGLEHLRHLAPTSVLAGPLRRMLD